MDNEELAAFLDDLSCESCCVFGAAENKDKCYACSDCKQGILEWLESEVKE
jgi:hypothetical protein